MADVMINLSSHHKYLSEIEVECDLICQEIKKDDHEMVDDGNCFKTCLSVSQSTIIPSFEFPVGKCQQEVMRC